MTILGEKNRGEAEFGYAVLKSHSHFLLRPDSGVGALYVTVSSLQSAELSSSKKHSSGIGVSVAIKKSRGLAW